MVWSTAGGTAADAVTMFAVAAARTTRINLGTSVVPTYPRHPIVLAAQALAIAAFAPGRFRLGVGPSHRPTIEGMFGLPFDTPSRVAGFQGALPEHPAAKRTPMLTAEDVTAGIIGPFGAAL